MLICDEPGKPGGRVALFMTGLAGGGAERVMLTLAAGFAEAGYCVDLVVTHARGELVHEVPSSVRLINFNKSRVALCLPSLLKYLREARPSVALSALPSTNCLISFARQLTGIPSRLIVSEHNHRSVASRNSVRLRERVIPLLMRYAYPRSDGIIAVSCGVADDLAGLLNIEPSSITVVYNPVVTKRVLTLSQHSAGHPWFRSGGPPVLLSVGRLTRAKDYGTLLRAFAKVRSEFDARLIILGEGEERGSLERLVCELGLQRDVDLPGFVSNPYAYMRAASLFVLSSRWEGLPTVLIEALACGTPVVSTDCPSGPEEILQNGKYGQLVRVGDPDGLAIAVTNVLSANGTDRKLLTTRAAEFSDTASLARYKKLLFSD